MEDGELVTVETTFNVLFFVAKQMSFSFFGRNTVQNTAQTLDFQQKTSYIHFFSKPLIQWIVVLRPEVTSRNEFFFPGGLTIP